MIYTVGFASSDGENVDTHYGHARRMIVYEIDTSADDYREIDDRLILPPCMGGEHSIEGLRSAAESLSDLSAVVVQRIGPGAKKSLEEIGVKAYAIPITVEKALCLLMEEKQWEVDKWRSHLKN